MAPSLNLRAAVVSLLLLLALQVVLGLFAVDVDGIESGPLSLYVSFETGRDAAELARGFVPTPPCVAVVRAVVAYGIVQLGDKARGDEELAKAAAFIERQRSAEPVVPVWLLLVLITLAAMAGCAVLGVAIERETAELADVAHVDDHVDEREEALLATLDLATNKWTAITNLGTIEQTIDASDQDGGAAVNDVVRGLPMPRFAG